MQHRSAYWSVYKLVCELCSKFAFTFKFSSPHVQLLICCILQSWQAMFIVKQSRWQIKIGKIYMWRTALQFILQKTYAGIYFLQPYCSFTRWKKNMLRTRLSAWFIDKFYIQSTLAVWWHYTKDFNGLTSDTFDLNR